MSGADPAVEGVTPPGRRLSVTVLWSDPSLYLSDSLDALRERCDVRVWYDTRLVLPDHAVGEGVFRLGDPGATSVDIPPDTDVVLLGGWRFPRYLWATRRAHRRGMVTVLAFDTQPRTEALWPLKARMLGRVMRRMFDGAFVPGDRQESVALALGFEQRSIQHGVYASRQAGLVRRAPGVVPPMFLWIGRLVDDKAVDAFLEAYARYRKRTDRPWAARIVGDGVQRAVVETCGIEGVEYVGHIPSEEIFGVMAEAGCFVSSSRVEPWGMVIAEAASMGLPVICTAAAGASVHLVTDGVSGHVVPVDDVEALSEAMSAVADSDPAEWEAMSRAGEALSRQFTPHLFADRFLGLVARLGTTVGDTRAAGPRASDRRAVSRGPAMLRRLSLGIVDQVLSSGSNVLAMLVAARALDLWGFGVFSLAQVTYVMTVGIVRALCSEALLVRPGDDPSERRRREREATGSAVYLGLLAAGLFAVGSVAAEGPTARSLLVLGLAMPGLLVQDTLRYAAFSQARPKDAVFSDGLWLVLQLVAYAALLVRGDPSAPLLVLAWAGSGVLAGVVASARRRVAPALRRGLAWVVANRDLSVRYALDFFSAAGATQLAGYVLVAVSGVAAMGSIRGAQTLFGPLNVITTGAYIALVPEGRRAAQRSTRSLVVICAGASAVFGALGVAMTLALLQFGDRGEAILGDTWAAANRVLLPVGLAAVAGGLMAGPMAGLRSLAEAKRLLRIRLMTMPTTLALPTIGAVWGDARGLAYGIALAVSLNVVLYWRGFLRSLDSVVPEPAEALVVDVAPPI